MRSNIDVVQLTFPAGFVRETASMFRQASETASELWKLGQRHSLIQVVILMSVVTPTFLFAPATQAQGGCYLFFTSGGISFYFDWPSSNILRGPVWAYVDAACTIDERDVLRPSLVLAPWYPGGNVLVLASDADAAWALCYSVFGDRLISASPRSGYSPTYDCVALAAPKTGTKDGSAEHYGLVSEEACGFTANLPLEGLRLHAFDGMNSGIQFRRLDNCGVGDPAVFEMGFLDAVDIWSNVGSGYSVCFPRKGRIVFLDAAASPRTLAYPSFHHEESWTCATMSIAGTMVLVEAADTPATQVEPTRRPGTDDSIDDAIELEDCEITPRYNLRLRDAPWGKILDVIPSGIQVPAGARTQSWFKVSYEEVAGWSAAWLAESEGDCEWLADDASSATASA